MYDMKIERQCDNCKEKLTLYENTGYSYKGKDYFTNLKCYKCGYDISEEDRKIIADAEKNDSHNLSFWMS